MSKTFEQEARGAQVFYPPVTELEQLDALRRQLSTLADRTPRNTPPTRTTRDESVAAVEKTIRACGNKQPLRRWKTICANGWIREAADEVALYFPELQTEQWRAELARKRAGRRRSHVGKGAR